MNDIHFWVRDLSRYTPAHVVARWHRKQAALMCGNEPTRGGHVITRTQAIQQQVHVCIGCARVLGGKHADVETLYTSHLGGSR
ncbi:hypothetical protein Cme02nite_38660 [Catellatospora methionotrophica]|uniref:Uncharacterized protein n=1 Tax=Catellatospora methionotrophica TaxID=121620 RepID=A0A8J3LHA2_9ACTN|nr:hypothetical protein [Catellatospora methionotrophica]GIG15534.1 hypothetical protein Cme02nite_38660 [Catellatospora methionotrophica]